MAVAVSPYFRENRASRVTMTKAQLQKTILALQRTYVKTQNEIASNRNQIRSVERQKGGTGAAELGRQGLLKKLRDEVSRDQDKLKILEAKIKNGPKIGELLEELDDKASVSFRIETGVDDQSCILVDGGANP